VKLSPEYVSPELFTQRRWFQPLRAGIRWFYHSPRGGPAAVTVLDSTLDPQLVPLVQALRARGLQTLASCAGHSTDPVQLLFLYTQLEKDEKDVRGAGLPVVDIETGAQLLWQDESYELPWEDVDSLESDLRMSDRVGAIGVRGREAELVRLSMDLALVPSMEVSASGSDLWLWVSAPSQAEQDRAWSEASRRLRG
jgi:hypothetical protein